MKVGVYQKGRFSSRMRCKQSRRLSRSLALSRRPALNSRLVRFVESSGRHHQIYASPLERNNAPQIPAGHIGLARHLD